MKSDVGGVSFPEAKESLKLDSQENGKRACPSRRTIDVGRLLLVSTRNLTPGAGEQRLGDHRAAAIWSETGIMTDVVSLTRLDRVNRVAAYASQHSWYGDTVFCGWRPATLFFSLYCFVRAVGHILDGDDSIRGLILSGPMPPWIVRCLIHQARVHRVRIIYDCHATLSELIEYPRWRTGLLHYAWRIIVWLLRRAEAEALKDADAILVVSPELAESLRGDYGRSDEKPVFVIPCGTDPTAAHNSPTWRLQTRDDWRRRLDLADSETVFVYCGGNSAWQQLAETIALFDALAGNTAGEKRLCIFSQDQTVAGLVKKLAAQTASSIIVRALDASDVLGALTACDVGLMLRCHNKTNHVAFPNKFSDYVQAGCYVLLSDATPAPARVAQRYGVGSVLDTSTPSEYLRAIDERKHDLSLFYSKCDRAIAEELDYKLRVRPLIEWIEQDSWENNGR